VYQVKADLAEAALAYLREHNVVTLATSGPQGLWAAAVFYVNDGFELYFLSAPTSRHSLNIGANPSIAATIQEDYRDWPAIKGIQLEGRADRITGIEQAAALGRYQAKFPVIRNLAQAPAEIARAMGRIGWYKITPDRLFLIDNSLGFGHRDEILLP
jgi:hypothetical protein